MEKEKILIIDDDPLVREILSTILSDISNYRVDTAVDGIEGIKMIKAHPYDLVLTDLSMPRMNGFDVLRELKTFNPFLPVVVITAFSSIDTAISAMKEGARDFITKPFSIDKVKSTVNRILDERRLLKSLESYGDYHMSMERLNAELFKKLQEISMLQSISSELDGIYDNRQLYERIVEMASKLLMAKEVSFGIIENGYLKIKNAINLSREEIPISNNYFFNEILRKRRYLTLSPGDINPLTGNTLTCFFMSVPFEINGDIFGVLNISDKIDGTSFGEDEINLALTFAKKAAMRIENNALYEVIYNNLVNTLRALIISIEARDAYTKNHSERVTKYALHIAEVLDLGEEEKDAIRFGGYIHDIGKIGIRDTVLLKPGKLTDEEMAEIRLHPVIGNNIVKPLKFFPKERDLILYHHERYDGKGYPYGLKGDDIPVIARVLAVADAYDAITSSRPYSSARSHEFAIGELKVNSNSQFDGMIVRAFIQTGIRGGEQT